MSPITIKLDKVDFDPQERRSVPNLASGHFIFECHFELEDASDLDSCRIVDVAFTDSLKRGWILLDDFQVDRSICSLSENMVFVFDLEELTENAHFLVEGSQFSVTLESDFAVTRWIFSITHKSFFGGLVWSTKEENING